ncbi:MAG: Ig-like domain-containing protein [Bacteroidales bacterium]|nr:Ig-like domain-containing protein [Bacteroidales bacterium]MDT8373202.1 LamG-like jellyroll fold domain-containing protein [Bacteroidales bacterium]
MKRRHVFSSMLFVVVAFSLMLTSCKKDPEPLALVSLMAGSIDLNGATSPNNVPVSPTIVATFNVEVDPATATTANITMVQDYDDAAIDLTVTASGKTITIVPEASLGTGALYQLSFGAGLKSVDALAITPFQRTFTTEGTFAPAGAIAHFTFEDNTNDVIGAYDPVAADVIDITYTASRKADAGKAATFNGTTSIIEIPNGDLIMNTNSFTVAFWMKTNSADKTNGHFVMGLAGWNGFQYEVFGGYDGSKFAIQYEHATGTASEDMWFPALADLGWQGWTYAKSLTIAEMTAKLKDNWINIVYTYNAPTKVGTLYFDGVKMKSFDFNLWPDGDAKRSVTGLKYAGLPAGNHLALGFIQGRNNRTISDEWADYALPGNNHFKGQLDDIRFWHKALTETEIGLMYNSEKP